MGSAGVYAQDNVAASDFDGSGTVDFPDFVIFAQGFGKSGTDPDFDMRLDLNGNGAVDFPDFVIFAQNFGKSTSSPGPSDRALIYISDLDILETGGKISVIDAETNLADQTFSVSSPRGMAYSSTNRRLYVAGIDSFYALTETGARDFTIPLLEVSDGETQSLGGFKVVLSPNHRLAFVTETTASQVEVIDLVLKQSEARIPVGPVPGGIAVSPDGDEVYAAHGTGIAIIDGMAHTLIDSISVERVGARRLAISSDGSRLYLTSFERVPVPGTVDTSLVAQILAIDPSARAIVDTLWLGDPADPVSLVEDLAMSKDGEFLYATLNREFDELDPDLGFVRRKSVGKLVIVDADSFKAAGEIVVQEAERLLNLGVSPDGKTAYATGKESIFDLATQIFVMDLETRESVGRLRGFTIPVEIKFQGGKPALSPMVLPEIVVF
jgi:DNA-binding beta-propeller fold protein YncE